MTARARRQAVRDRVFQAPYRVEWLWQGRVDAITSATLARATDLLLEAFGGDAEVRRRGSGYEVLGADGYVVARMWRA